MPIRANREKIETAIRKREPFKIASMSGKWLSSNSDNSHNPSMWGQLPYKYVHDIRELLKTTDVYVVYSYQTPIAWAYTKEFITPVPNITYSVTTTNHQHVARMADIYGPISTAPNPHAN